jgi:hypothetical protein
MRPLPLLLAILSLPLSAQAPLLDALSKGKATLELRTRFEHTEDQDFKAPADHKTANAFTNRTLLGFETGALWDLKATLQFANVTAIGDERYNSGLNGRTNLALVQDPGNTEVLQAYISWKGFKLGRQVLRVDNQRFIGPGAWSQMPKAFTGLTYQGNFGTKWVELSAGHLTQLTTSLSQTRALKVDFARLRFTPIQEVALTPFWFGVEETTRLYGASPDNSVQHVGLRADGTWNGLVYDASFAQQRAYKASTKTASRDYLSLMAGYAFSKTLSLKATHEVLGGAPRTDALQNAFTTPMSSLHGFYGWSDRLGATPATGIVDDFLQLEAKGWGLAFEVQAHAFKPEQTDRGFTKYGRELDVSVTWPVTKNFELTLKAGDYKGDGAATAPYNKDLRKLWLMSTFKF